MRTHLSFKICSSLKYPYHAYHSKMRLRLVPNNLLHNFYNNYIVLYFLYYLKIFKMETVFKVKITFKQIMAVLNYVVLFRRSYFYLILFSGLKSVIA